MIRFNLEPGRYRIKRDSSTWTTFFEMMLIIFAASGLYLLAYNTISKFIKLPSASYLDFLVVWVAIVFLVGAFAYRVSHYDIDVRKKD